jgi:hypothetical protein
MFVSASQNVGWDFQCWTSAYVGPLRWFKYSTYWLVGLGHSTIPKCAAQKYWSEY